MDTGTIVLTAGILSMGIMEAIKWIVRLIKKNSTYALPASVYWIGIPVLNLFTPYALVWLGVDASLPLAVFSWLGLVKLAVLTLIGSVISWWSYTGGLKPLKDYAKSLTATA